MTDRQMNEETKHAAKEACRQNGIKVSMTNMVLLEAGYLSNNRCDSVMFRDRKSGKEYHCHADEIRYSRITHELFMVWSVTEY